MQINLNYAERAGSILPEKRDILDGSIVCTVFPVLDPYFVFYPREDSSASFSPGCGMMEELYFVLPTFVCFYSRGKIVVGCGLYM